MARRFLRLVAVALVASLFTTGCMISRAVDRAFVGMSVRRPTYLDRKTTGIFLLPITFVLDVATFPIQALLVVILGDNFPFTDSDTLNQIVMLQKDPRFQRLDEQRQAIARAELEQLLKSGAVTKNTALALGEDGHWTLVALTAEAREQLIVRAQAPAPEAVAVCLP